MLLGGKMLIYPFTAEADPHFTRHGDAIYKYIVADKTGSIVLSIWGDRAKCIKSGDILRVTGA